jgi:hypothetical protein
MTNQTPLQKRAGYQVVGLENINPTTGVISYLYITDAPAYTAMPDPAYPYLSKNFLFKSNLFKNGSVFGSADIGIGDIEADNTDGFFDQFRFFGFDGRRIKIWWIESPAELLSNDNIIFSGTQDYPEITEKRATFHVKNKIKELDVQAQTKFFKGGLPDALYAGVGPGDPILDPTGGVNDPPAWGSDYVNRLDGEENLYGTTKPIVFGRCMSFPLTLVNSSKGIYACNYTTNGDRKPINNVRRLTDQGVTIVYGRDYLTSDLLLAATTAAGFFDTCISEGLFKLGSKALGDVIADIDTLPIESNNVATVVSALLEDLLGYEAGIDFSSDDLYQIAAKNPAPMGICVTDKEKVIDLASLCLSSVGGWMATDEFNMIRFGRIELPDPENSIFTFTDDYIKEGTLQRIQTGDDNRGIPARQVTIRHTKNWKTLNLAQSLQSVDQYYRLFLAGEYRSAVATDDEITQYHPSAPSLTFDTVLLEGQRATIVGWDFSLALNKSWTDTSVSPATAVINASNQLVLTPGASTIAGVSQVLSFPGSAFGPGKYRLGLTSISGSNLWATITGATGDVAQIHFTAGFLNGQTDVSTTFTIALSDFNNGGNNIHTVTLKLYNERVGATQIQTLDNVYIQEYLPGLTPTQEAQRRLTMLKADVERFTFTVSVRDGKNIALGSTILIQTDRFSMQDGDAFNVIGKIYDTDSNEIQFDVWG